MPYQIDNVQAIEILDSRAKPTLQVAVTLAGGIKATAGVPSGPLPDRVRRWSYGMEILIATPGRAC